MKLKIVLENKIPSIEERKRIRNILKALNNIDWNKFYARVAAQSGPEIEAYREARRRGLEHMHRHPRFFRAAV